MSFLQGLLGPQRQEFDDFVNRYDQGAPWEGISEDEALSRYQQVATQVPPDVYQQSAEEAFSRLSPQQRIQLGQHLRQRARDQNVQFADFDQDGVDDRFQDPRQLAQFSSRIDQQQPGLLGQLLAGAGGLGGAASGFGAGAAGGAGGGAGGMLENPIAKAALAGIAAMAAKRMMGGR